MRFTIPTYPTNCLDIHIQDPASFIQIASSFFTMSGLEKSLFNLKFTAKQLNRQAQKAGKDETAEKNKLKKVHFLPYLTS